MKEDDDIAGAIYDFARERGYRLRGMEMPERIAGFGEHEVANRVEEREGPFSCPFCGSAGTYSAPATLVQHIVTTHPVVEARCVEPYCQRGSNHPGDHSNRA